MDWLDSQLIIAMPVRRPFISDKVYRGYDVTIEGLVLAVDLILIDLKEFDAILRMDWLSIHRAKVDCVRKKVVFHTLDGQRACFIGERNMIPSCMILALTANKLIRKRCEAFIACAISSNDSGLKLVDILVVCRFSDVFFDEHQDDHQLEKWNLA